MRPDVRQPRNATAVLNYSSPRLHNIARSVGRHIQRQCVRLTVLHQDRLNAADRVLLAPTHVGHLEPIVVSGLRSHPVHWMTRTEFYKYGIGAWALRKLMTFPVNRQGIPVSSIRCAISLLDAGRTVGMFPEGGVARGEHSMMHGGRPKGGVCLISMRTGAPIIPIALVGIDSLSRVQPWVPFRRGRAWIAVGAPIVPPPDPGRSRRRAVRQAMIERLAQAYVELCNEIESLDDGAGTHPVPFHKEGV